MSGNTRTPHTPCVRIPAEAVTARPGSCPTHVRASADHKVEHPGRHKPDPLCTDPLTALNAALDLVELDGRTAEEACARLPRPGERPHNHRGAPLAPLHEGLLTWVRHAVRTWLGALEGPQGQARVPCAQPWLLRFPPRYRSPGARTYEILAHGRSYTLLEGTDQVRELRVPVVGTPDDGAPGPADAIAAHVLATGSPVDRTAVDTGPWRHRAGHPLPTRGDVPAPDRVRVLQVSCTDGTEQVRFDGTPAEAGQLYTERGRPALRALSSPAGARVPGPDCAPCKLHRGCDGPAQVPGLLGFRDRTRPRRTWSVQAGLRHRTCPASAHLHDLGLPGAGPSPETVVRARLARAHRRSPSRACTPEPRPRTTEPQVADLLSAHAGTCALHTVTAGAPVHAGLRLPLQDPLADVLVLARVDLLHRKEGSWIQRQTAVTDTRAGAEGPDLLDLHPELALSVLLFASGTITPGAHSRVELERLTPQGARVDVFDPFSPGLRDRAAAVVSELASPWHQDTAHAPAPGPACGSCPQRRWCPEAPAP
ncbi:PD-(D/E)XK nuclease family protein [Nocardiopsis kunsanensis]|uniref:PD-(D/E)XK nuclease family protein n=1 Tax=Nocardiopsis kunsanensis TaxID=141693 RepID=UPI00034D4985|nr:hypothetical protein [Nocardiopsis kunsanensis]